MHHLLKIYILLAFTAIITFGRIHNLTISNDHRKYIALTTFGFYQGGFLNVKLKKFITNPETFLHGNKSAIFGFSLDRSINDALNPYLDSHQDHCILEEPLNKSNSNVASFFFILDLKNKKLKIQCGLETVHIYKNQNSVPDLLQHQLRRKRQTVRPDACDNLNFDINSTVINGQTYYNTSFVLSVATSQEEGLYNLYFHNCPNYEPNQDVGLDFTIEITEHNTSGFLSAGEMPLPALYSMMAILFLLSGCFWVFLLRQSRHPVFKIHYMMAVLVFLKAISLAFHGVNYYYIERLGVHLATWAILFYIAHLLKGALLFVVLVLVGTGWTFIKHVLAPRDKRLFMAVIPLQVLANVADIILEESEEGAREYIAWRNVFTLVDLLCCGCILFPVVWSIRHLKEANKTDGKAAMNLKKLKLFRHFYVMIVCYIYSTRIIVYLMRITVPFQYGWMNEMFREMATYVFFVLTAYKFRPASHNPYFALSDDEDDDEIVVLTESGATEGLSRVISRNTKVPPPATLTEVTEEEKDALLCQSESSHEYD